MVLKFVHILRERIQELRKSDIQLTTSDMDHARHYWIKESRSQLHQDSKFTQWKTQFDLFVNELQMWW